MTVFKTLLIIVVLFLTTGCVSTWRLTDSENVNKSASFGITLQSPPRGWYKRDFGSRYTLFTKHGPGLEYVSIEKIRWRDTLSNGRTVPENLLLHQLSEVILGERIATGSRFNFKIAFNKIIPIDSVYCTGTGYTYTSSNTMQMKGIVYCIPFRKHFTVITYEAESSCYFRYTYKDFKKMAKSLTIGKKYLPLPGIPPVVYISSQ